MTESIAPEFISEAQEIVDQLNSGLIAAEHEMRSGEVEPSRVNDLFRSAHSLKGLSGMFGLDDLGGLAHVLESVLDGMRLGRVVMSPQALDVLFACVESASTMIAAASSGDDIDILELEELIRQLEDLASGKTTQQVVDPLATSGLGPEVLSVLTEYEEHRLRENLRKNNSLYLLRTAFDLSNFDVGLAELDAALAGIGEIITKLSSSEATAPDKISFDIVVGSQATLDALAGRISDERVEVIALRYTKPESQGPDDQRDQLVRRNRRRQQAQR